MTMMDGDCQDDTHMLTRLLRIALFCPSLGLGGSERQLGNLAVGLHTRGHDVRVLVLYGGEPAEDELRKEGIPVINLGKKGPVGAPVALFRLRRYLKRHPVDILYSFHGLPNLLALLVRSHHRYPAVIVGVRATCMDMAQRPWLQRIAYNLEPKLAMRADLVIANSHAGCRDADLRGFPTDRLCVVPNGTDTRQFSPDRDAGLRLRRELHIAASTPLVGMVARIDQMKDHRTFFQAAVMVRDREPVARFLCVWDGDAIGQAELAERAAQLGLNKALTWVRGTSHMRDFYNAMDVVASSSSYGEGFPNVVGEAMACGCICVVTDVGDSARLVDGLGIVVPPKDAVKLAEGILKALSGVRREEYAALAREHIVQHYSLDAMVENTLQNLLKLVGGNSADLARIEV